VPRRKELSANDGSNEASGNGKGDIGVMQPISDASSAPSSSSFVVTQDGSSKVFATDFVNYRVSGLKEEFTSQLRVNIKAELRSDASVKHYDNLDLYSSRSRKSFSGELAGILGIEPRRIERDLIAILEHLEKERDRKALIAAAIGEARELTDEQRKLGGAFLKSRNKFKEIVDDMTKLGYVGEDRNKVIMYLVATSRLMDKPLFVIVVSQSGSGKSMLIEIVEELLPQEDVLSATSFSDKALNYAGNVVNKFMYFGEAVHKEEVNYQIREIQSKGLLSRLVTITNPLTGERKAKIVKTIMKVATSMTTTREYEIDLENASRNFILWSDESVEQTARIHVEQRRGFTLERYNELDNEIPRIIEKHRAAQSMLKNYRILNPYGRYLKYPERLMRTRRDNKQFLNLLAAVCFLRQGEKEVKLINGVEYIEIDMVDYEITYDLMMGGMIIPSVIDVPRGAASLYEQIRELCQRESSVKNVLANEVAVTQREIREWTNLNNTYLKRQMRTLLEYEYLVLLKGGQEKSRGYYRLVKDAPIGSVELSQILSPSELRAIMAKEADHESGNVNNVKG
jgi:energy-coupling factor transporter ATP-binding protein EcfA2